MSTKYKLVPFGGTYSAFREGAEGGGGLSRHSLTIQSKLNCPNDAIKIVLHLIVPKADIIPLWDNLVPQRLKTLASLQVIFGLVEMLASVKFNDQFSLD